MEGKRQFLAASRTEKHLVINQMIFPSPDETTTPSNFPHCFGDETEMSDGLPRTPPPNSNGNNSSGHSEEVVEESLNEFHSSAQSGQSSHLQQKNNSLAAHPPNLEHPQLKPYEGEGDKSFEAADRGFSQELLDDTVTSSSSAWTNSSGMSANDDEILSSELHTLFQSTNVSSYFSPGGSEPESALCEDIHGRIFCNFDDKRYTRCIWEDVIEEDNRVLRSFVSPEELELRAQE